MFSQVQQFFAIEEKCFLRRCFDTQLEEGTRDRKCLLYRLEPLPANHIGGLEIVFFVHWVNRASQIKTLTFRLWCDFYVDMLTTDMKCILPKVVFLCTHVYLPQPLLWLAIHRLHWQFCVLHSRYMTGPAQLFCDDCCFTP